MTFQLEFNEHEAELLHQALMLIVQASSPELMRQFGWEGADHITAATLIQNIFDPNDIKLLNKMAIIMNSMIEKGDSLIYSKNNISEEHNLRWQNTSNAPNLDENVVDLDTFRK